MAKQEIKTINGNDYVYLTYYDDVTKKKKSIYCGPGANADSKKKAIEKEIEIIDLKIREYQDRKRDLSRQLKRK